MAYRTELINRWVNLYLPRMVTYQNDGSIASILRGFPVPQHPRFRLILVTHDESTFYANDRRKLQWNAPKAAASTEKKGEGTSIMISDFLTVEWGRLVDNDGEYVLRIILEYKT